VKNNEQLSSLLPYLKPAGHKGCLNLTLISRDLSEQEKSPFPFLVIHDDAPLTRMIEGQFVTDAGSAIKRVFLLVQKDQYHLSEDKLRPLSNPDIDRCWQRELSHYSEKSPNGSSIVIGTQLGEDGSLLPLRSLFYCKTTQTFFHPPCPTCGRPLQQCYDDDLLPGVGLLPYSSSLRRYLFCPFCHDTEVKNGFYAYSLRPNDPSMLKDRWALIKSFSGLKVDRNDSNPFPCSDWAKITSKGLAVAQKMLQTS